MMLHSSEKTKAKFVKQICKNNPTISEFHLMWSGAENSLVFLLFFLQIFC